MKNKAAEKDFSVKNIPSTRKEQFFDLFRHNFSLLFSIGLIMLLFAVPFFTSFIVKQYALSSAYESLEDNQFQSFVNTTTIIFDAIYIVTFGVIAIGLSGIYRIYRKLCWGEGIHLMHDLGVGIKQNWLKFLIISVIFSLLHLLSDYFKITFGFSFLSYVPFAIEIVIIPVFLMFFVVATLFNLRFKKCFLNSVILCLKKSLYCLLFCLFPLAISFVNSINYTIVQIIVYLLLFLFLMPLYILISYLFSLSLIDECSNKIYQKDFYKKGLSYEYENDKDIQ